MRFFSNSKYYLLLENNFYFNAIYHIVIFGRYRDNIALQYITLQYLDNIVTILQNDISHCNISIKL